MSVVTKRGDGGKTILADGREVYKHDDCIIAIGAMDELNAHLGVVKAHTEDAEAKRLIDDIQKTLMQVMGMAAGYTPDFDFNRQTALLESRIAAYEKILPKQDGFVLYGASAYSAYIQVARSVSRRAEAVLAKVLNGRDSFQAAYAYMNRLSDFLFVWACYEDFTREVETAVRSAVDKQKDRRNEAMRIDGMLTLAQAKAVMERIEQKALEMSVNAAVAVCNAQGNPVAVQVMDGAFLVSFDVAAGKAYTAAALRMATASLHTLVQPGAMFYSLESLKDHKIVPIAGGVPLYDGAGRFWGAVGVSGGTDVQDADLADYGAHAFKVM